MKCKRNDKFNPDTSRICSDHFRDLKGELTKNLKSKVNEELQKTPGHFLTKNQIKMKTEEKKMYSLSAEETAIAFCLRYLSRRAYIYLRKELKYPLPRI